jgi:hypothetical protein
LEPLQGSPGVDDLLDYNTKLKPGRGKTLAPSPRDAHAETLNDLPNANETDLLIAMKIAQQEGDLDAYEAAGRELTKRKGIEDPYADAVAATQKDEAAPAEDGQAENRFPPLGKREVEPNPSIDPYETDGDEILANMETMSEEQLDQAYDRFMNERNKEAGLKIQHEINGRYDTPSYETQDDPEEPGMTVESEDAETPQDATQGPAGESAQGTEGVEGDQGVDLSEDDQFIEKQRQTNYNWLAKLDDMPDGTEFNGMTKTTVDGQTVWNDPDENDFLTNDEFVKSAISSGKAEEIGKAVRDHISLQVDDWRPKADMAKLFGHNSPLLDQLSQDDMDMIDQHLVAAANELGLDMTDSPTIDEKAAKAHEFLGKQVDGLTDMVKKARAAGFKAKGDNLWQTAKGAGEWIHQQAVENGWQGDDPKRSALGQAAEAAEWLTQSQPKGSIASRFIADIGGPKNMALLIGGILMAIALNRMLSGRKEDRR